MNTTINHIRKEVMARAWRALRGQRGAKATPKTHPKAWRNALINAWHYAKQALYIQVVALARDIARKAHAKAKTAFDSRQMAAPKRAWTSWKDIRAMQSFGY